MNVRLTWALAAATCLIGAACQQAPSQQPAGAATSAQQPGQAAEAGSPPATTPAGAASTAGVGATTTQPPASTDAAPATPAAGASPAAGQAQAAGAPAPLSPPPPEFREVTVPAGTALSVVLDSTVTSDGSRVEDVVHGHLASTVRVSGVNALPAGSKLVGTVVEVQGAGKVKGVGRVAFRFDRIAAHGESHEARTSAYAAQAKSTKGKDAKKIGIGAGAGALVGGIVGGGKGAAIGAGVGGGAGTGVVLATKGEEATVAAGRQVRVTLREPVTVRVPVSPQK
jgi:hypothetical protein